LFLFRNCDIIVQSTFALVSSGDEFRVTHSEIYIQLSQKIVGGRDREKKKSVIRLKKYTNHVLSRCDDKFSLRIWEFASKPSSRRLQTSFAIRLCDFAAR